MLLLLGFISLLIIFLSRDKIVELVSQPYSLGNKNILVLFRYESIMINSHILMIPEMNETFDRRDAFWIS